MTPWLIKKKKENGEENGFLLIQKQCFGAAVSCSLEAGSSWLLVCRNALHAWDAQCYMDATFHFQPAGMRKRAWPGQHRHAAPLWQAEGLCSGSPCLSICSFHPEGK